MKLRVDVDCTPEEARRFLGLPDVSAMNEALVAELREKMASTVSGIEPDALFKLWMGQGVADWPRSFWSKMSGGEDGGNG